LLCGNEQGNLFLFSKIDNNLEGDFVLLEKITETIQNKAYRIDEGIRVAATVADIDGDSKPDLFVGNWAGGVSFFKGTEPVESKIIDIQQDDIIIYPNPTTGELTIDNGQWTMKGVEIYDMYGRKQFSIVNCQLSIEKIDISHFSAGIYFVKITTETGIVTKKVINHP